MFSDLFGSALEPPPSGFQMEAIKPVKVGCVDTLEDHKRDLIFVRWFLNSKASIQGMGCISAFNYDSRTCL